MNLTEQIRGLLECVCVALAEAEREPCKCYMTVGPPIIGLCCQCDHSNPDASGELTAHLETVYDVDPGTLQRIAPRIVACKKGARAADVVLTLTRCYPTIDQHGNIDSDDIDVAADLMHTDLRIVHQALRCCGERLMFRDIGVDSEPSGGCSALMIRVTIEV